MLHNAFATPTEYQKVVLITTFSIVCGKQQQCFQLFVVNHMLEHLESVQELSGSHE